MKNLNNILKIMSIKLSIVTPVYKGKEKHIKDFNEKYSIVSKYLQPEEFEMIYVFDGSLLNSPLELQKYIQDNNIQNTKLIIRENNMGKGYSVREGLGQANGEYISFIDFEPEVSIDTFMKMFKELERTGMDYAIGNRFIKGSHYETTFVRKIVSICNQIINKIFFGINFPDSQAGAKIFRATSYNSIKGLLKEDRYALDIEIILYLQKFKFTCLQYPIEYLRKDEEFTTVNLYSVSMGIFTSILKLWWRIKIRNS